MADRADIIAKVCALRARAGDSASSEAEAETAARKAAKIIADNQLTEAELRERGTAGISEATYNDGRARQHPALDMAGFYVGKLSECVLLVRRGECTWVGQPEDVAFAIYLCELIEGAAERAYKAHWSRSFWSAPHRHYRQSFMLGFGSGLSERLLSMAAERDRQRASVSTCGTAIVEVKEAIITAYLSETRPMLRTQRAGRRKEPNIRALLGGIEASRSVVLSRPINGDTQPAALRAHEQGGA